MRRVSYPLDLPAGSQLIPREQRDYSAGMMYDIPWTEIPINAVVMLINLISYGGYLESRRGSRKILDIDVPHSWDLTSLGIYKDAGKIYNIPTSYTAEQLQAGDYLVWGDGTHDQLVEYNAGGNYWVSGIGGDHDADNWTNIRKPFYAAIFHQKQKKFIFQIGNKLYTIDNDLSNFSYTEIAAFSSDIYINQSRSVIREMEKDAVLFNADGIFKIVFGDDVTYYTRINEYLPPNTLEDVGEALEETPYGRRYVYSESMMSGSDMDGDRYSNALDVIQQTGTNVADAATNKDYADIFDERQVGLGAETYGYLYNCFNACTTDMAVWNAIYSGSFKININGVGVTEITTASFEQARDMGDVALIIENALRRYFQDATCTFEQNSGVPTFRITSGKVDGTSVSFVTDGSTGRYFIGTLTGALANGDSVTGATSGATATILDIVANEDGDLFLYLENISGTFDPAGEAIEKDGSNYFTTTDGGQPTRINLAPHMALRVEDSAVHRADSGRYTDGYLLQYLYPNLNPSFRKQFTHYTVFSSKDIGLARATLGNIADFLIWNMDIPMIKPFTCSRTGADVLKHLDITGNSRKFKRYDEANWIKYGDDGSAETAEYLASGLSRARSYDTESTWLMAATAPSTVKRCVPAVIGGEKVAMGRMVNGTITLAQRFFDGTLTGTLSEGDSVTGAVSGATATVQAVVTDPDSGDQVLYLENITGTFDAGGEAIEKDGSNYFTSTDGGSTPNMSFASGDENDVVFFEDGSIAHMRSRTDAQNMVCWESDTKETQAIGWSKTWRKYMDTVTDKTLASRENKLEFVLQSRYWEPISSSSIGDIVPGYVAGLNETLNRIEYSAPPANKTYLHGQHHKGYHIDDKIHDEIKWIKKYPDLLVVFGARSTWSTPTNLSDRIDTPIIGESLSKLRQFSIKAQTGTIYPYSLQDISVGESVLMTNEPAMRSFNGYQFSEVNIAEDRIMSYLQQWAPRVVSSYDAVGGYIIYGTPNLQTDIYNKITPESGECFRLAVEKHQGRLWSKYQGAGMVWPEPLINGLTWEDQYGNYRQAMVNERDGRIYDIATRPGPANTDLEICWLDRYDGEDGTEISSEIWLAEDVADKEHKHIEHLESHLYVRPYDRTLGYRDELTITAKIFKDGALDYHATSYEIPKNGDYVFDRKSEANRLQIRFYFTAGAFRITGNDSYFIGKDRAGTIGMGSGRTLSEQTYQREYYDTVLWMSRGFTPELNRSIGNLLTGDYDSRIAGPDGQSNSALSFDGVDNLQDILTADLTGDFTIQFGYKV